VVSQELGRLGVDVVNAARRWAHTRARCRRLLDSKKASPHDVATANKVYLKASDELEMAVRRLSAAMVREGANVPMNKRTRAPFPWKPLITAVGGITKALEEAVRAGEQPLEAEVIDVTSPPKGK